MKEKLTDEQLLKINEEEILLTKVLDLLTAENLSRMDTYSLTLLQVCTEQLQATHLGIGIGLNIYSITEKTDYGYIMSLVDTRKKYMYQILIILENQGVDVAELEKKVRS